MRSLRGKKTEFCILLTLISLALTGCTMPAGISWPLNPGGREAAETSTAAGSDAQFTTLGLTPDLDYDKPVVGSHIEIDQLGYRTNDRKIAIFRGDVLSDSYSVVDAESGRAVYSGVIESKAKVGTDEIYYYGDFSELKSKGTYYICTDVIGYSYPFSISDDIYSGLYRDAVRQYYMNRCGVSLTAEYAGENVRSACHTEPISLQQDAGVTLDVSGGWHLNSSGDRYVSRGCNIIEALLLAYEYNTQAFDPDADLPESGNDVPDILDELKVETDWILKMQDQSTGMVYSGVISTDKGLGLENPCYIAPADISTTLSFASALGYFSYIYQSVDTAYATTCLQAADRAMKYVARSPESVNENEYFRAATMLYRATGYQNYRNIIDAYCADRKTYDISDNVVFSGVVSYLATKQKTDPAVCGIMMNDLRKYAENMSSVRRDMLYLLDGNGESIEYQSLLAEIARLTVVNYIISSNEYENLMGQYLHYLLGCNPYNTCYVGQYGSVNISDSDPSRDILRQPESDAYFILLLSGIGGIN